MHCIGNIQLDKIFHLPGLPWGTVESQLVASSKSSLESCLGSKAPEFSKIHDSYSGAQVVSFLHRVSCQDLDKDKMFINSPVAIRAKAYLHSLDTSALCWCLKYQNLNSL